MKIFSISIRPLIVFLAVLILASCSQAPTKPLPITKPPAWYLTPPKDTPLDLYGAGAGKSREKAVQAALNDLASKLGVEVSSQFQLQHKSTNSAYAFDEETTDQKILTEVQTTTLNQYQVVKTEQTGYDQFYVLVKTDKNALAFAIRNNLEQQVETFLRSEKSFLKIHQTGYLTWQFYSNENNKLPSFKRKLAILQTLKKRENTTLYKSYLNDVNQKYNTAKTHTKFFIKAQSDTAQQLQLALKHMITVSGFSLVDTESSATDIIKINATEKTTQAYGFTVVRSQASVELYENHNLQGSNQFTLKGQGLNQNQASINLQNDFKQQLSHKSIAESLGLTTKPTP
ncbi:LPP20 family lipoprotein [Hydrogenovibrio kuenenii]|uniref:LPP20 family lipoprotein n=1 Tax=Hydrogenovibrio kuenenii TaxID=63658 RepID=UPI000464DE45|nr:LPP20 family lipoprotein [Hydrogenovibrio kuenenii]